MAFDLVQYFAEQINNQKPQLLEHYSREDRKTYLLEINNSFHFGELTIKKFIRRFLHPMICLFKRLRDTLQHLQKISPPCLKMN